jgi:hypothetical protein
VQNVADGSFTFVPGGSLPITGTRDGTGTEVANGDGSLTQAIAFT